MVRIGKVYSNLMVDLQVTCEKLRDRGERILSELLNLDQPAAAALLDRASGDVKTALVMGHLGIDREEALERLDAAGGVVSMVIGGL
jgi:N-acetylmuramic acid 6-phosphate etherase